MTKLICDCGKTVELKNGRGKCSGCGTMYGGTIHTAKPPRSHKKAGYTYSSNGRVMWQGAVMLVIGIIVFSLFQTGKEWVIVLTGVILAVAWILSHTKKGRKA